MEERKLICINCPLGCSLTVTLNGGEVIRVAGNTCPRGEAYGRKECTHPTRIVTGTGPDHGRNPIPWFPWKTASDIPKEKMQECAAQLKTVRRLRSRSYRRTSSWKTAAGCGVPVIATKNVERKQT